MIKTMAIEIFVTFRLYRFTLKQNKTKLIEKNKLNQACLDVT